MKEERAKERKERINLKNVANIGMIRRCIRIRTNHSQGLRVSIKNNAIINMRLHDV